MPLQRIDEAPDREEIVRRQQGECSCDVIHAENLFVKSGKRGELRCEPATVFPFESQHRVEGSEFPELGRDP